MKRSFLSSTAALGMVLMATAAVSPMSADAQSAETQKSLRQLSSVALISGDGVVDLLLAESSVKKTRLPKIDISQLKLDEDNSILVVGDSIVNSLFTDEIIEFASTGDGRAIIQAAWDKTVEGLKSHGTATVAFYTTFVDTGVINTIAAGHAFKAATVTVGIDQMANTAQTSVGQASDPNRVAAE